jgi:hypothetical protein
MLLTAYLDESGTHNASPISVTAGYLGTATQWRALDADWVTLLQSAGVHRVHAVDLFKRTRQFKEWPAERVNTFAVQLDGLIARHMELGFSVVVRDDDYRKIYVEGARPRRSRLDSKYGVCFRACLAFCAFVYRVGIEARRQRTRANDDQFRFGGRPSQCRRCPEALQSL